MSLLLCFGTRQASAATYIPDGSWVVGVGGGAGLVVGATRSALGLPLSLSGQFLYHPRGENGLGLQVDEVIFQPQNGAKAELTALVLVSRFNANNDLKRVLPYVLFGLGYCESHAEVERQGKSRGSGPAIAAGLGFEYFLGDRFSIGMETRLLRAMASMERLGLGGATILGLNLRLNVRLGPVRDFFN